MIIEDEFQKIFDALPEANKQEVLKKLEFEEKS